MNLERDLLSLSNKRVFDPPLDQAVADDDVRMRTLMADEVIAIERFAYDGTGSLIPERQKTLKAMRLKAAIVDEKGNPRYDDAHLPSLAELPDCVMSLLMEKYWKVNSSKYAGEFLKNVSAPA
jgi:hypothetical protein